MAVISHFAYFEFHKIAELPTHCRGFQLEKDSSSTRAVITDALLHSNVAITDLIKMHNITSNRRPTLDSSKRYEFQYSLYNWKESGVAKVNFHDTDILISTSNNGKELVIAFGGTASPGDLSTNLQTFEPANHSSFFGGIEGSLHRGFLNAYSRVDQGYILPIGNSSHSSMPVLDDIHRLFTDCKESVRKRRRKSRSNNSTSSQMMMSGLELDDEGSGIDYGRNTTSSKNSKEKRRRRGCHVKRIKLSNILRRVVINALQKGLTVHVAGHSLGGALATIFAGDVIVNHPSLPLKKLRVWVYGSPQIADDTFLYSAMNAAPKLKKFLTRNGRFNRFVTLTKRCKVDAIVDVTKIMLSERKKFGGVHGSVVHFAEPRYLLTDVQLPSAAHVLKQYLKSLAATAKTKSSHPLAIDLPSLDLSQCVRFVTNNSK